MTSYGVNTNIQIMRTSAPALREKYTKALWTMKYMYFVFWTHENGLDQIKFDLADWMDYHD